MKSVIRGVYIALVGLIVFTGALYIAQGALTPQKTPAVQEAPTEWEAPATREIAPEPRPVPFMPDAPATPV